MIGEYENFICDKYGYCYYAIEPNEYPIIYNLYTEPEYRKQGHAKRHLLFVINEIRNTGYTGIITIEVEPRENSIDRESLSKFYKELGLTVIKE